MKIIIIIVAVFLLLWAAVSYFVNNVETLEYSVLEKKESFEIRNYSAYLKAEVEIEAESSRQALNTAFSILAGYIFGDNISNEKISMTAPVLEQGEISEKIAMTAPVLEENLGNNKRKVAFTIPKKFTLESLPTPKDDRIKIVEVAQKKIAAKTYGYITSYNSIDQYKKDFVSELQNEGYDIVGEPFYAGYNDPYVFPLLAKNEILVEIK